MISLQRDLAPPRPCAKVNVGIAGHRKAEIFTLSEGAAGSRAGSSGVITADSY